MALIRMKALAPECGHLPVNRVAAYWKESLFTGFDGTREGMLCVDSVLTNTSLEGIANRQGCDSCQKVRCL